MEGLKRVLALAAFEARLSRRMVRVWVLGIIAILLPFGQIGQLFFIHRFASGYNGSWAAITRDLIVFQPSMTTGALMGLFGVFYVFDWRHRDVSRHFAASLDSSPLTRLQHAWGKYLGVVPVLVAPMLVVVLAQVITTLAGSVFVPVQVYLACWVGLAIPLALTGPALAFGLSGLFRNQALGRALGIAAGVGWLAVMFGVGFGLKEKHSVLVGALVDMPVWSDWVGYEWSGLTLIQRAWGLAVAALFVCLASLGPLGLPENAAERRRRAIVVGGLAVVAIVLSAGSGLVYQRTSAHAAAVIDAEARASSEPRLSIVRREASVDLSRKGHLSATATLEVRNGGAATVTAAVLRLNPGLEVTSARVDGQSVTASRDASVVRLPVNVVPGGTARIEVAYEGSMDAVGADPQAIVAVREAGAIVRNNRRLFGTAPLYLERSIAVLPMDSGFLPDTALIQGADHPRRAYPDVAPARLSVVLPEGWKAYGPGRRTVEGATATFVSDEPIAGIGLVAGRFDEAEMEAGGTTFRLAWHPKHARNVEFFASAREKLQASLQEKLADVSARTGLQPPPELSVVDVPQLLSTYMGTWDSTNRMGQPGLVLVKEGSLFGARFEQPLKSATEDARKAGGPTASAPAAEAASAPATASAPASASEFDPAQARLDIVTRFFSTDFTGGSVPRLAMRSFWDARVQPEGEGLAILGPSLSAFVAETALGTFHVDTSESARIINDGQVMQGIILATRQKRDGDIADVVMRGISDPDEAYAYMVELPLEQMDPAKKPQEWAGVLYIKGRRPLLALRELLGAQAFAGVVASLAAEQPLTWTRFRDALVNAAPAESQARVQVQLDNWLSGTRLPGFVVEGVRTQRIQTEPERWQVLATIRNEGDADGVARLVAGKGSDALALLLSVPAGARIEAGLLSPRKLDAWKLESYLALNRTAPAGSITAEPDAPAGALPFEGQREAPATTARPRVIVDNLDEGFSVMEGGQPRTFAARDEKGERILGTWAGWNQPGKWRRWRWDGRWSRPHGAFDETAAIKRGDDGEQPATWRADLSPGAWRVETHLPSAENKSGPDAAKEYEYVVVHSAGEDPVKIALDPNNSGWTDLGRFRFDGAAEVRLLDKGEGLIVADAVRFTKETE